MFQGALMQGLMMDYQLTLCAILRRAEQLFGRKEIVTRLADKSFHRYTYADCVRRAKQLSVALQQLGVQSGDRVATFCWNHHQHLEAYFGVPASGAVLHTLNLRLHPDDLTYIINEADDKAILIDSALLPLFEKFRERVGIDHVIVVGDHGGAPDGYLDYEQFLAAVDPGEFSYPELAENQAAAMCYTSGTTGQPKGVLYSHRAIVLHSLGIALPDSVGLRESDVVLPVVPMFHVNAWGLPFAATFVGAKQVFPGPHLDPTSLLEAYQNERVTLTAGVPTIWLGILQALDEHPGAYDLSNLHTLAVGGAAAPKTMIRDFQERHGLNVLHAWGMTETTPLGTVARIESDPEASEDEQYDRRAKQGQPVPLVEIRARNAEGVVPWDGETMGELEVRGPWVAAVYYKETTTGDRFTPDGWFRTGDIVTIDERGWMEIQDRAKDLVKSGGEWISSVALENALMGHPAVAEAAVIALPHPKWQERPLAAVVLADGKKATADELRAYLGERFAKWWVPDSVEFVEEIPRTAVGKFKKTVLRERFRDYVFESAADSQA
jgi:fatty-acyl-CoA synthase